MKARPRLCYKVVQFEERLILSFFTNVCVYLLRNARVKSFIAFTFLDKYQASTISTNLNENEKRWRKIKFVFSLFRKSNEFVRINKMVTDFYLHIIPFMYNAIFN